MSLAEWFEWLALAANIAFLLLLTFERRWSWVFGGIAAGISVALLASVQLYYESVLNAYYVFIAIWAYRNWSLQKESLVVSRWNLSQFSLAIVSGISVGLGLGWISQYFTQSDYPYADAFITAFSFIATLKEARKILSAWTWWFVLNLCSAWLYYLKGLEVLSIQMLLFAVLCIPGYLRWYKSIGINI